MLKMKPQYEASWGYIVECTPHFMCWKYFDECFMDKNLLHISLSTFNKRRKRTFLITQFKNRQNIKAWFLISKILFTKPLLYIAFIFSTFSVYLWRVIWSASVSVQFFFTPSQNNMLWIVCAEELKIVCLYMITFDIFCISRIGVKENVK